MDSAGADAAVSEQKDGQSHPSSKPSYVSMVDPFLVEALQNPRHRLTILRMELDMQKFLQNNDQMQFEFPHFPTSYLRLAAHRVSQHYGLQTMVQDNVVDGLGNKILVIKNPQSKFPALCLSDVPAKDLENDNLDGKKIVIRPRPKDSSKNSTELAHKSCQVRTIEERKEEYDRARARIFGSPNNDAGSEGSWTQASPDTEDEHEVLRNLGIYGEKGEAFNGSRVAILRDREKDRTDPDYDRSYDRYVRSIPTSQSFNMAPFYVQKMMPPFVQYDPGYPQRVQTPPPPPPPPQAPLNYRMPLLSPYSVTDFSQNSGEASLYVQWPTQSMMYAQSYDQLRHGFFQAPFYQQPLSFDYSQNYHR